MSLEYSLGKSSFEQKRPFNFLILITEKISLNFKFTIKSEDVGVGITLVIPDELAGALTKALRIIL